MSAISNNRESPRRRILKGAVITSREHLTALTCAVRDLSPFGARLRIDSLGVVPSRFTLIVALDGIEIDGEVVWHRGRELGVKFVSPPRTVKPTRVQIITPMR